MRVRTVHILKALIMLPALFVALAWAESFARRDIVWILCPKGGVVVSSSAGKLQVLFHTDRRDGCWTVQHEGLPAEEPNRIDPRFQFHVFPTAVQATLPHWFLLLLLGFPAMFYLLIAGRLATNPKLPPNKSLQATATAPVSCD